MKKITFITIIASLFVTSCNRDLFTDSKSSSESELSLESKSGLDSKSAYSHFTDSTLIDRGSESKKYLGWAANRFVDLLHS